MYLGTHELLDLLVKVGKTHEEAGKILDLWVMARPGIDTAEDETSANVDMSFLWECHSNFT